ncbi:MAG: SDR family oxidoreductase, partial [Proteobacteria bacterium]|nr:SDR family oxidoreductase [Pseudomonadota bacterium]
MSGRVQDKVALVVGAGSVGEGWGNGKAAAALYAREGARVLAADVNLAAAEETRDIILREGGEAVACQTDATVAKSVEAVAAACMDAFGRIDILHNNVGGSAPGGPVEMSEEVWDANIDLNLKSVFLACKYVLPIMERQGGGAIVNISSVAGFTYYGSDLIAYKAAKSGLVQFTRGVAMQYVKKGIRANTVVPGLMNTPLVKHRIV